MATTSAGLALCNHVIPLVSLYNDKAEGSQVSLSCYINLGDGSKEKRKYNVPLVTTQDVEILCHCVLELKAVMKKPYSSIPWDVSNLVYVVPVAHSICSIWLADQILWTSKGLEKTSTVDILSRRIHDFGTVDLIDKFVVAIMPNCT